MRPAESRHQRALEATLEAQEQPAATMGPAVTITTTTLTTEAATTPRTEVVLLQEGLVTTSTMGTAYDRQPSPRHAMLSSGGKKKERVCGLLGLPGGVTPALGPTREQNTNIPCV